MRPITDEQLEADSLNRIIADAPPADRLDWQTPDSDDPRRDEPVVGPGDAAATAGDRAPKKNRENWVPIGPRNIGGRITALAIHPGNATIIYAGTPAGGVFKTVDRGETWFPLWHEQPTLSIADIDIWADGASDRIWVATGDAHPNAAGRIDGDGIYLSDDGGETWERKGGPVFGAERFDAIAADPSDADFCFAVGEFGVLWTQNGGDDWERFTESHVFTDVAYTGGPDPRLYIVAVGVDDSDDSFIIKLDDPRDITAGAIDAALGDVANRNMIRDSTAAARSWLADHHPVNGRVALTPADHDVVYAHFAREYEGTDGKKEPGHQVLVRCDTATANPWPDQRWERLPPHRNWTILDREAKPVEGQAGTNLTLAVDPTDADRVVTGMIDLYVTTNGTDAAPDWRRAMAWEIYHLKRAHHADHLDAVFDPTAAADPNLWVANDGGISVSADWHSATVEYEPKRADESGPQTGELPGRAVTWTKRSNGIDVTLPYSVAQSPIIPSLYGCGFQDNGVFITSGGLSWELVIGADGGYIAFDPDDPHQLLATWQGGIAHVAMPGRLRGTLPTPGIEVTEALWARSLNSGFLAVDDDQFVANTAADPIHSGRAIHVRENRFYRTDPANSGETWVPAAVGPVVDLVCKPAGSRTRIDVRPSAGGRKLGLEPQRSEVGNRTVRIRTNTAEPFAVAEGDQLDLEVNGTRQQITFRSRPADALDVGSMSAVQLAEEINRQSSAITGFAAHPGLRPIPADCEIITDTVGGSIEVEPSAGATALGLTPGIYEAAPGQPAVLVVPGGRDLQVASGDPAKVLALNVDGNPVGPLRFEGPHLTRLDWIYVRQVAEAVGAQLAADPVRAEAVRSKRGVRIVTEPGVELRFSGTARDPLDLPARTGRGPSEQISGSTDLSPVDRVLIVGDGANTTTVTFRDPDFADITQVQPAELVAVVQPALVAAGVTAVASVVGNAVEVEPDAGTRLTFSGSARQPLGLPAATVATETIAGTPDLSPADLTLSLEDDAGNRADIVFDAAQPIADRAATTVAELDPIISAAVTAAGVTVFTPIDPTVPPTFMQLRASPGTTITIGGTARGALGLAPITPVGETETITGVVDLSPIDLRLEIGDGTDTAEIVFDDSHGVVDLSATTPGELEPILSNAIGNAGVRAATNLAGADVEIVPNAGITLTFAGTAVAPLGLPAAGTPGTTETISGNQNLAPTPRRLTVRDTDAGVTVDIDFDAAQRIVDRAKTQPMELLRVLHSELVGTVDATVTTAITHESGEGSLVHFDPERPGRVWAASVDGLVYRSADGGATWTPTTVPPTVDRNRFPVALAFHPTEDRTVYLGMVGHRMGVDPGFLFRSEDDGASWEAIGDKIKAGGRPTRVRALAVDPAEPDHLYAGSDSGVWRSTNRGRSWDDHNEGLPNARVFDLVMERQTRTLRAALWGRSLFERRVGSRRADDVQLSIRANGLDDGRTRPAPIGPDVFARQPRTVVPNDSPDIKIARKLPEKVGFLDGVEFDERMAVEPPTPGPSNVAVQVNNRGAFPADDVRAVVLWADVTLGPPALPDDLWERFRAGPLAGAIGPWNAILDETLTQPPVSPRTRVAPGYPRVFTAAFDFPATIEQANRLGFLALCSCPDDELETDETDINCLLAADRRFAYRELEVARTVDVATLHIVGRSQDQTVPFLVSDSTAPSAMGALDLEDPILPVGAITGGREPFNLTTGTGDPGISFSYPIRRVTIEVDPADFTDPGLVSQETLATVLNRELLQQQVPIRARFVLPDELHLEAHSATTTFEVTGGSLAALTGLPVGGGPVSDLHTTQLRYSLDRSRHELTLSVQVEHTVRFPEALTTAAEVREAINDSMVAVQLPIRAEIPRVDLRVRRSATGSGSPADVTARGGLADVVANDGPVAPGGQEALFDLVTTFGDDRLTSGTSHLYLRATNVGTADVGILDPLNPDPDGARIRMWEVKPVGATGGALTLAPIGERTERIVAGQSVIAEFEWTPTEPDPESGQLRLVLAAVDHAADRPILVASGDQLDDTTTTFASVEELHELCLRQPGVAYRELRVE